MVLWICAQDKKILLATSRYFQSPFSSPPCGQLRRHALQQVDRLVVKAASSDQNDSGPNQAVDKNKEIELSFLNSVAADFYRLLHLDQDLDQKPIDIQVTCDGLRMTLFDRSKRPLFTENGAEFTAWGKFVMQNLAWLIDRHHFRVTIDGHTRSNLILSRRRLHGLGAFGRPRQRVAPQPRLLRRGSELIERVTGYADTRPLAASSPIPRPTSGSPSA